MYDDNFLSEERAREFLPFNPPGAQRKRGRPATGWFGQLVRVGDLVAAGYGAQLVAKAGAVSRTSGHQRAVLAYAWDAGSRNAVLADEYSKRILADGLPDPSRPHLALAEQVCVDALAVLGTAAPLSFADRLIDRLDRIRARQASPPRKQPEFTRNGRAPRRDLLSVPH
jgi:hypothetical protein